MLKEKKQIIQSATVIRAFGIMILIAGCLLGIDPARARNKSAESTPGLIEVAAAPLSVTIVVDGGGQAAIENALKQAKPGDTILVKAGNYDDNDPGTPLEISISGTEQAPIILLGEDRPRVGNLKFSKVSHFILAGFEVAYQSSDAFFIGVRINNSHHLIIRDMLIHDLTGSAISTDENSHDIVTEDSKIYEILPRSSGEDAHCFVNSAAKNITFRNNECYGFIGDGYHAWRKDKTILYDRGLTLIEGNTIYNTQGACSENGVDIKGEAGTIIIRNNTFYGFQGMKQEQCAIHASGCGDCQALNIQDGGTGDLLIENNKIFDSNTGIFNHKMKATIQNNIIHDIAKYAIYDRGSSSKYYHNTFVNSETVFNPNSTAPTEVVNNLFYNAGNTINGNYHHNGWFGDNLLQPRSGDVTGEDPRLNPDYSLQPDSLLIDRGVNVGVTTDFSGVLNSRPSGSAPDIGAFEYLSVSPVPTPSPSLTPEPTDEPNPEPTDEPNPETMVLTINGPESIVVGETIQLSVEAHGLSGDGLYGAQLEISFDPTLLSVSNVQINPDFTFVLQNSADNTLGKIILVASRQGRIPGLTGNITLFSFEATALSGDIATLSFENVKMGDPQAVPLALAINAFTLLIDDYTMPKPTDEPTPEPTDEPIPEPTDEPIPRPTDEPTPEPTDELPPEPTDEPTPQPTDEPTPQPTDEPTPEPTDETPPEPTDEPTNAVVFGQLVLTGRADNDWSGGTVTVDDSGQSVSTTTSGNFTIADVAPGPHSSITADGPGYLPAVCTAATVTAPETVLTTINLLSGDINDDDMVDIADATAIGVGFGQTGLDLSADINRDEVIDIFDLILVGVNFEQGAQAWDCLAE